MSRGQTAQKVRAAKEAHPEQFCPVQGCLWRVETSRGTSPCRKHGKAATR